MVRKLHETDINQIFPFSWIWEFFAAVEKNKCFSTAYLCMFRFLHQQQNGYSINILNIAPTPSSMEESLFHVPLNSFLWRVAVLIVISFSCLFTSAVHPSFFSFPSSEKIPVFSFPHIVCPPHCKNHWVENLRIENLRLRILLLNDSVFCRPLTRVNQNGLCTICLVSLQLLFSNFYFLKLGERKRLCRLAGWCQPSWLFLCAPQRRWLNMGGPSPHHLIEPHWRV